MPQLGTSVVLSAFLTLYKQSEDQKIRNLPTIWLLAEFVLESKRLDPTPAILAWSHVQSCVDMMVTLNPSGSIKSVREKLETLHFWYLWLPVCQYDMKMEKIASYYDANSNGISIWNGNTDSRIFLFAVLNFSTSWVLGNFKREQFEESTFLKLSLQTLDVVSTVWGQVRDRMLISALSCSNYKNYWLGWKVLEVDWWLCSSLKMASVWGFGRSVLLVCSLPGVVQK